MNRVVGLYCIWNFDYRLSDGVCFKEAGTFVNIVGNRELSKPVSYEV